MRLRTPPTFFTRIAKGTSRFAGKPATFALVVVLVLAWAVSGPVFGYSDTWQLTINTFTTIVTFLMVFLIQATQNRDSEAIQIKLGRAAARAAGRAQRAAGSGGARGRGPHQAARELPAPRREARSRLRKGRSDTDVPDIDEPHKTVVRRIKGGQRKPR
jgi:hypothetical protein